MYSQNNEDDLILEYFAEHPPQGGVGRFLDIGAHDGATFSNTLALIELGWHGVMVEPSPAAFAALLKRHGGNERLKLINAAVAGGAFWEAFHESEPAEGVPGMVGSMNDQHVEKWSTATAFRTFYLHTVSVPQLLDIAGAAFDFVNIDVEGDSAELFFSLAEAGVRASCWCVEHDEQTERIMQYAEPLGLRQLAWNQENVVLGL